MISAVVLLLGLLGIGAAAVATMREANGVRLPGTWPLAAALVLTRVGLSLTARAWIRLLGVDDDRHLIASALYESQLTKYLPAGGFVQAAGQVGLTALQGIPVRRASAAFLALMATVVASGLFLAAGLALAQDLPAWLRFCALGGALAPLLGHRRVMGWMISLGHRITRRLPGPDDLPSQRALWESVGLGLGTHLVYGLGFAVLLDGLADDIAWAPVIAGYVASWVLGFLILPLPSGVGVRELVLLAVMPGLGAGPVLAASLAQRIVTLAAEVLAVAGGRVQRFLVLRAQDAEISRRS